MNAYYIGIITVIISLKGNLALYYGLPLHFSVVDMFGSVWHSSSLNMSAPISILAQVPLEIVLQSTDDGW